MASTSTSYQPRMIVREQPTSSGQVMSVSSGCKVAFTGDAILQVSTGATIVDSNVYTASSAMAITNRRTQLILLDSTKSATYTLSNIPNQGDRLELVAQSTFDHTVRFSTDLSVHLGTTASTFFSLVISPTPVAGLTGAAALLRGLSSNRWILTSGSTALVAGSTACT